MPSAQTRYAERANAIGALGNELGRLTKTGPSQALQIVGVVRVLESRF